MKRNKKKKEPVEHLYWRVYCKCRNCKEEFEGGAVDGIGKEYDYGIYPFVKDPQDIIRNLKGLSHHNCDNKTVGVADIIKIEREIRLEDK